ncbi:PREDICTED: uncharacterized protein LOC106789326 [Polistes canadensis]|uniref:uncharacterized protein LOC106789326 n=1 Tax=Polistes canadensis TaxID=91411 RepID=UPI000718C2E7|nr:PREDICTED: uncharacterized protein LOC106789326 [Polistes canadensis]XP_014608926.1 PREDICTED: uncharacterized protein LOC106789326 [Polistes canadensis]
MSKILQSSGGVQRSDVYISFLVVGRSALCEHLSDGLHKRAKEKNWYIEVHKCESISEVLENNISMCIDFIIFVFDSLMSASIDWIETNIGLIDEHFIISGACCLVHDNSTLDIMSFVFHNLKEIRKKYNIRFLSAKISDPNRFNELENRILALASTVLGLESQIPTVINTPWNNYSID